MADSNESFGSTLKYDVTAGVVVFLVALPLCLGIAVASDADPISGLITGIVAGIVVGFLSKSHTSVSGPAAGLTAIIASQLSTFGELVGEENAFKALLAATVLAGLIQIGMGLARWGFIAMFVPTSVIKGLLAAIGVILILKQVPHLLGDDDDAEGEMSFFQPDEKNTFSEFLSIFDGNWHLGATVVGVISIALLVFWNRNKFLKNSPIPGPLVVVVLGVLLSLVFRSLGDRWVIRDDHLVDVPSVDSFSKFGELLTFPDFGALAFPELYIGAITIALVASLETLLNLEATDRLDKFQRRTPPSHELVAQGVGNTIAGCIGGLPMTSVIVRSSVNINTGARTKFSAILHGFLLLGFVVLAPHILNMIPLASLAAILIVTGFKLASPQLFSQMYAAGRYQFAPFLITVLAIVFTDLLVGVLIGLAVALSFILYSNVKRPLKRIVEKHVGGEVMRIELGNQVSFLNRAALENELDAAPEGASILIDARNSAYVDPDVLNLVHEFKTKTAPARGVTVSLLGFRQKYMLDDEVQYVDYSSREVQDRMMPNDVLELLLAGNERFREGKSLTRRNNESLHATARGQHPLAVVLSCMDSRAPVEILFDCGLGDVLVIRVAGNVVNEEVLASVEFGCLIERAPLVLVMGHTDCGSVATAIESLRPGEKPFDGSGCTHLEHIADPIARSIEVVDAQLGADAAAKDRKTHLNAVSSQNVWNSFDEIVARSDGIRNAVAAGTTKIVAAMYDVQTGHVNVLTRDEATFE